jgi:hypothetical protein
VKALNAEKYIRRYGLSVQSIEEVDLKTCYIQGSPNRLMPKVLVNKDGEYDTSIFNSPHYEICFLYYRNGDAYVQENYHKTRYCKMRQVYLGNKSVRFPSRVRKVCESIKQGYLNGKYKNSYIVLLDVPLAKSRYNRNVDNLVPEIFMGHHRTAALLAFGIRNVRVIMAKDNKCGSCVCYGKIHDLCFEK